ncbi:sulfite exporter TauE/SafE family protein [Aestuariivita boseongensis]|uniref:sulfite exporter TauE/SafE family protein n=1 Tax=Aestuariivita boseongensis TaxID=1470562 RepID=UPI0006805F76|nr:sulfite exporter TauE/SafE family protein [Aestuariivita boseongensis]
MTSLFPYLSPDQLAFAFSIAVIAGLVKGIVGFAMPMILVSGLGTFLPPELALVGLILPTVVTNGLQALRNGGRAALASIYRFRWFMGIGGLFLIASAQLFRLLSGPSLYLLIGIPVTVFAVLQLRGWQLRLRGQSRRADISIGTIAGAIGGVSGVWGPPTVAYLTALNTPKAEQMRVQGVIYGLGAVALLFSHIGSGVMTAEVAPFSLVLVVPAVVGMWLGRMVQDRIDQAAFRRATLMVLLIAGLNLVRRGLGF